MKTLHLLFLTLLLTIGIVPIAMATTADSTVSNPLRTVDDTITAPRHISVGCGLSISPFYQNVGTSNGIQTNLSHGMSIDFLFRYAIDPRFNILSSASLISHGHYEDMDNPYFLGISSLFQARIFGNSTQGLAIGIGPRISYNVFGAEYPTVFKHLLTEAMGRITYESNTDGSLYAFGIESTYFLTECESNVRLMSASVFFNYFF